MLATIIIHNSIASHHTLAGRMRRFLQSDRSQNTFWRGIKCAIRLQLNTTLIPINLNILFIHIHCICNDIVTGILYWETTAVVIAVGANEIMARTRTHVPCLYIRQVVVCNQAHPLILNDDHQSAAHHFIFIFFFFTSALWRWFAF